MASQEIRFAEASDGIKIAYCAEGQGPPLLFINRWGWSIVHYRQHALASGLVDRLTRERTVISFDRRGIGSSERDFDELTLESELADVEAVVRSAKLERFDLVGDHDGAHLAAAYAARYPKRVRRVVLLRLYRDPTVVYDPAAIAQLAELIDTSWQLSRMTMATWALRDGPAEMVPWFAAALDQSMSPAVARRYVERMPRQSAADVLDAIAAPVLVLHWRDDQQVSVEQAKLSAALVPDCRIIVIDAPDPPWVGSDPFFGPILEFLNQGAEAGNPAGLTGRELQILALLAAGKSNQEIAHALSISSRTAERHIGNIYLKIGAHNRAEATAYAFRNGVTAPPA